MADDRLRDVLAALDHEREAADRAYNAALTALDRAMQRMPDMPHPPPAYDEACVGTINDRWQILPDPAPVVDRTIKGRLRGFIWRLVGPPLEAQRQFNAAVVDHLNRNLAAHREAQRAAATTIEVLRQHVQGAVYFESRLIQYLQTFTAYVDTKDRRVGGDTRIVNAAVDAVTDDWLKRWASLAAREARFQAGVGAVEDLRASIALAQQTSLVLKREVERLITGWSAHAEAAPASAGAPALPRVDLDAFKYLGFEDAFRGSREDIRARLSVYVPHFAGRTAVLDLGCGRGEFLDLLREHGIGAQGVDSNHEMVEAARARGLDVAEGDALTAVRALADGSIDGAFAAQVVEHLDPGYLMTLLETLFHKLRPHGVVVFETINPACWLAFFESYIRDLTHVRAIHPETLQYLLRATGFHHVTIDFLSPVPESARLQPAAAADASPALVETFNENVAKLNARMFTFQDYAAIGRK